MLWLMPFSTSCLKTSFKSLYATSIFLTRGPEISPDLSFFCMVSRNYPNFIVVFKIINFLTVSRIYRH